MKDNVLVQLANLQTHPSVAKALVRRKVTLHGRVYDIGSGSAETLDTGTGRFTALAG